MRTTRAAIMAFLTAVMAMAAFAPGAGASSRSHNSNRPFIEVHVADLQPVPHDPAADGGSDVTGKVAYIRVGDRLIVLEFVRGAAGELPHAQHVHGIDVNHNGAYDFDAGVSSLDPSLPLEATVPAACGVIR